MIRLKVDVSALIVALVASTLAAAAEPARGDTQVEPCETWSTVANTTTRTGAASIWDPVRHRMIMFGGYDGSQFRNDLISLNGAPGSVWTPLFVGGVGPTARDGALAVYDPVRDRMILFGGNTGSSPYLSDVWTLSLSGTPSWTQLTPAGAPPSGRFVPSMIYDPVRDRLLVFGGTSAGPTYYNEVWQLALSGTPTWSLVTTAGTPPSGRYAHVAIYDPVRDRMLIYGGENNTVRFTQLWQLALNGTPTWSQLHPLGDAITIPAPHTPSAVYDPVADRVLFYGGYDGNTRSRLTSLSLGTSPLIWTRVSDNPLVVPPRDWQSAVYDPDVPRMLLTGGQLDNAVTPTSTYALALDGGLSLDLSISDYPYFGTVALSPHDGCFSPGEQVTLTAMPNPGYRFTAWQGDLTGSTNPQTLTMDRHKSVYAKFDPSPTCEGWTDLMTSPTTRAYAASIWDPVHNLMIVFGGLRESDIGNDVIVSSGVPHGGWATLPTVGTPPIPRYGSVAAYDPVRNRLILFGGNDGSTSLNDVWALSISEPAVWTQLTPAGAPPAGRYFPSMIYDPVRDRLIVFGGDGSGPSYYDVWELTLAGTPTWNQLVLSGGQLIGPRSAAVAFYEPTHDRMIAFGGFNSSGILTDVWQLSLSGDPAWSQLQPVGKPPVASLPGAVFDPTHNRMVVFGGSDGYVSNANTTVLSLKSDPPLWVELHAPGPAPSPRSAPSAAYDPGTARMVLMGGTIEGQGAINSSTYSLALSGELSLLTGVNDPNMGSVQKSPPSSCLYPGEKVTLTAVPFTGYRFNGWLGDLSGSVNPQTVTMDDNKVVMAQFTDAPVATLMSLFEAEPVDLGIEIRWRFTTPGDVASVAVERAAQAEGPWVAVDAAIASRGDMYVVEDRTGAASATSFYRLVVDLREGGRTIQGPISATATPILVSDLTMLAPSPTHGETRVDFAVAHGGTVRISVLDIAGRERAVLARGTYPAGRHTIQWDGRLGGAKAAAGIYFLRFEGPGQTRVKRLVML